MRTDTLGSLAAATRFAQWLSPRSEAARLVRCAHPLFSDAATTAKSPAPPPFASPLAHPPTTDIPPRSSERVDLTPRHREDLRWFLKHIRGGQWRGSAWLDGANDEPVYTKSDAGDDAVRGDLRSFTSRTPSQIAVRT